MSVETETAIDDLTSTDTIADLLDQLGDVSPSRVRLRPAPGTATEAHVVLVNESKRGLCELIDGALVEKAMGIRESVLASILIGYLRSYLGENAIGVVFAADAMFRMSGGNVRLPDVSFIHRDRFPGGKIPRIAIGDMPVDLAVEIKSPGNSWKELERKGAEYFASGTRLYWIADPETRSVRVYSSAETFTVRSESESLDGGELLPGFAFSIRAWFNEAETVGGTT